MKVRKPTEQEISATGSWGTWSKEPSTFAWYYDDKETCYILEGKAKVTDEAGNSIEFSQGDMVEFEQRLECTWEVIRTIKKRYKFG